MQTFLSPAKLNLFLHVVGRRPDGYHELQFEVNQAGKIHLVTQEPITEDLEDNIILKAAV